MTENTDTQVPTFVSQHLFDTAVADLAAMTNQRDMWMQSNNKHHMDLDILRETIKEFILENRSSAPALLDELAEVCEIDLSKEITFEVNVRFHVFATVPTHMDEDEIRNLIENAYNFATLNFDEGELQDLSADENEFTIDFISEN